MSSTDIHTQLQDIKDIKSNSKLNLLSYCVNKRSSTFQYHMDLHKDPNKMQQKSIKILIELYLLSVLIRNTHLRLSSYIFKDRIVEEQLAYSFKRKIHSLHCHEQFWDYGGYILCNPLQVQHVAEAPEGSYDELSYCACLYSSYSKMYYAYWNKFRILRHCCVLQQIL